MPVTAVRATMLVATVAWAIGEVLMRRSPASDRMARAMWTLGVALALIHVVLAFQFVHAWSHEAAVAATVRQAAEVFGSTWRGGVYVNYAFLALWCTDVCWWWIDRASHASRPRWLEATRRAGFLFMFINGAIVFASGFGRVIGIASVMLVVAGLLLDQGRWGGSRTAPTRSWVGLIVYLLVVAWAVSGVSIAALQQDACARLTSAEAGTILNATVGRPRAATKDLATECSYETTGSADRRIVLTVSVYETGRAGLRGSAASYFADVRRTSMHMRLPMQSVDVGDEGYWMGGVLHVRQGQDLALAIELAGATAAIADQGLSLSTKVATLILGKLDGSSATRETLTIATNTHAHREDLRIAVGNIWEEPYTPEGGAARTGLTAMLDMGVPQDPSRHQHVRVHPGQRLRVFGYVIEIVSVERSGVRLALERESRK